MIAATSPIFNVPSEVVEVTFVTVGDTRSGTSLLHDAPVIVPVCPFPVKSVKEVPVPWLKL